MRPPGDDRRGRRRGLVVSKRLTDTPCILVTSKFGWSANMERIMKAQAMGDNRAQEYMKGKKTMEINPKSPVILDLKAKLPQLVERGRRAPPRNSSSTPRCSTRGSPSTSPRRSRRRSSTSWARLSALSRRRFRRRLLRRRIRAPRARGGDDGDGGQAGRGRPGGCDWTRGPSIVRSLGDAEVGGSIPLGDEAVRLFFDGRVFTFTTKPFANIYHNTKAGT